MQKGNNQEQYCDNSTSITSSSHWESDKVVSRLQLNKKHLPCQVTKWWF
jgi:hypothetical protein